MKIEIEKQDLQDLIDGVAGARAKVKKLLLGPKIHIHGLRWFQKTYGNTYNQVKIYLDDELAAFLPEEYGYGEYYLQRAWEWLMAHGYVPRNESYSTVYLREVLNATWMCGDVKLRRQLWKS